MGIKEILLENGFHKLPKLEHSSYEIFKKSYREGEKTTKDIFAVFDKNFYLKTIVREVKNKFSKWDIQSNNGTKFNYSYRPNLISLSKKSSKMNIMENIILSKDGKNVIAKHLAWDGDSAGESIYNYKLGQCWNSRVPNRVQSLNSVKGTNLKDYVSIKPLRRIWDYDL